MEDFDLFMRGQEPPIYVTKEMLEDAAYIPEQILRRVRIVHFPTKEEVANGTR